MQTIDRERIEADWAARRFSCEVWVDAPGRRWEDFTHATDELVLVREGTMEFEVEGESFTPRSARNCAVRSAVRSHAFVTLWTCGPP